MLTSLPLDTVTIVDVAGLADKTRIGPTRGRLREGLRVSKIDIPPKTDVHIGIFTIGELTGAKIGANVAGDDKIQVKTRTLTIHTIEGIDTSDVVTAVVDDSVIEDVL